MNSPSRHFSEGAKKVLTLAQEEAEQSRHSWMGTEHLLVGLLRERDGLAAKVLNNLGVEIGKVRLDDRVSAGPHRAHGDPADQPHVAGQEGDRDLGREASRMGHNYVGTEHLLLGLLIEGEGIAAHVLADLGASLDKVRAETKRLLD
ncbi:MAG: hypothetical protein JF888_04860 [Candidatus Dormibacteraeota bacterium]|uniref:Clp R domain-containing protein n=1 Tax=Candidatus Dormiibacter inghamiae TaxID=3127013 RepID=A0A934NBJ5_9BACT|nr:hypothetical protein [Candidatus Dormibacteraeota bacterium]MBJ7605119.1 hypothetical protein [Candidatus Dormibacteraeota bacterium]